MKQILITLLGIAVASYLLLFIAQPRKTMEVSGFWMPPTPEFITDADGARTAFHDTEKIIYRVFYSWGGRRDPVPWWIITDALDGQWRIIEAPESEDISMNPLNYPLFEEWAREGRQKVRRNLFQKVRLAVFGTDDSSAEDKALGIVMQLLDAHKRFQAQGNDLYQGFTKL